MASLKIAHLYPDTLRLNGEAGNVTALVKRANWSGITTEVTAVELGHRLPHHIDILFIGSGTMSATKAAADALAKHRDEIVEAKYQVVAVGSGWDLISEHFSFGAEIIPSLGLTQTTHIANGEHRVGEVVIADGGDPMAGFINSDRVITGLTEETAFGRITASDEARLVGLLEGYRDERVLAARLQGPLLPMNPGLADDVLCRVLGQEYSSKAQVADTQARLARQAIANRVGFKS